MTIETRFDIPLIAGLALKEKQIQQNYRPIIAVHKWFARRPGTLFRGLALSEFGDAPVSELFFRSNDFPGVKVADPFMGGGTPLIEANRIGCDVSGFDINPMSAWIVREEIDYLDLEAYGEAAQELQSALEADIGTLYRTDCPIYGDKDVPVKYFLWVKTVPCEACDHAVDLFPGYLISEDSRHPKNVLLCPDCGQLNEVADRKHPSKCLSCSATLRVDGPARRSRCACPSCGHENKYSGDRDEPPDHRLFAIEYYNPHRKAEHKGRFFKAPDEKDLKRAAQAQEMRSRMRMRFVPKQEILPGDETQRLHRWGYRHYRELFNDRQLVGLELSARLIDRVQDERVKHALATNFSDLLRYQNMLCRYDTWALKSLDVFSVHGFPAGLIQCESNLLGITNGNGMNVGSGGWTNVIAKYAKAKRYCDEPFEVRREKSRKVVVPIEDEWIGERSNGRRPRSVQIHCLDATQADLAPGSLDAVFTDPPYFGNVQYGELMDFCYVWLRRLVGDQTEGFSRPSTRSPDELTGNKAQKRDLAHFAEGLGRVYGRMAQALKPGAPLAFTYHHNKAEAYHAAGVAILDAGLTCSASLPCPAEMAGSIHIHGTASSIVDTVFVCRTSGWTPRKWLFSTAPQLAAIVADELSQLREAGMKPTAGDTRCIIFGHMSRMTIWNLRATWDADRPMSEKLDSFAEAFYKLGDVDSVAALVAAHSAPQTTTGPLFTEANYKERQRDAVSF